MKTKAKKVAQRRKKPLPPEVLMLAKRIRALRIQKGYSSYEYFAYENDFAMSQYARYERGEDLRFSTLVRLAKAFNISLEEFFSQGFKD